MKRTSEWDVYKDVKSEAGFREIFRRIRHEVERADSRPALTELYKRAAYLIKLTYSPGWKQSLGQQVSQLRSLGKEEFGITAQSINRRAAEIGFRSDYDETWGR